MSAGAPASGRQGSGARGSASSAASARSSASSSGLRPCRGAREHRRARALAAVDREPREEPWHGAAVADEDAVAAAVELEPEAPAERPPRLIDHGLHACHLVERSLREHAVVACRRGTLPTRARSPAVDHSCPSAAVDSVMTEIRLDVHGVGVRVDEVSARCGRLGLEASSARDRVARGPGLAGSRDTCRRSRARRSRRAARRPGSSSARARPERARARRPRAPRGAPARDGGVIVSQISPGGSRWRPDRCDEGLANGRAAGRLGYVGAQRRRRARAAPAPRSCMTQTAVNVFVIEPIRYACSGVASSPLSTSARPSAAPQITSPSRNTAALTEGIRCSACAAARIRSSSDGELSRRDTRAERLRDEVEALVDRPRRRDRGASPRGSPSGGSSTTGRRRPRGAARAPRPATSPGASVDLDEVRLDPLEVDREAGRVPALARAVARARGRRRAGRRGGRARRRPPPRRSRPGASRRRRDASRARPAPSALVDPASTAPSGQPSPFERQSVTVSKRPRSPPGCTPCATAAFSRRAPSRWTPRPALARRARRPPRARRAARRARPRCCACSRATSTAGRWSADFVRDGDCGPHLVGATRARLPRQRLTISPACAAAPAVLVDRRRATCSSAISTSPGRECSLSAIWFAIVAVGQEERLLLAEQLGDALLQLVDGRILAPLLVADLGGGDRGAHSRRSGRWPCRSGGRSRRAHSADRAAGRLGSGGGVVIVVGIDGGDLGKEALRFALHEATMRGTRVRAVHAWDAMPVVVMTGPGMVAPVDLDARPRSGSGDAAGDRRVGRRRPRRPGRARGRRRVCRRRDPRQRTRRRADRRRHAAHTDRWPRSFLGSVSHHVVRHARCPARRDAAGPRLTGDPRLLSTHGPGSLWRARSAELGRARVPRPAGVGVGCARRRGLRRDDERPGPPARRARERGPVLDAHGRERAVQARDGTREDALPHRTTATPSRRC